MSTKDCTLPIIYCSEYANIAYYLGLGVGLNIWFYNCGVSYKTLFTLIWEGGTLVFTAAEKLFTSPYFE